jgi:hypothetical protein
MVVMVTNMKKHSVLGALIGGVVVATVSVATVLRYRSFRQLKEEMDAIPYDLEKPFSWKHFFKQY